MRPAKGHAPPFFKCLTCGEVVRGRKALATHCDLEHSGGRYEQADLIPKEKR